MKRRRNAGYNAVLTGVQGPTLYRQACSGLTISPDPLVYPFRSQAQQDAQANTMAVEKPSS
jgi:hypothetical protein